MTKTLIIITDSNTYKQIRPYSADIHYHRFTGYEIRFLMEYIDELKESGLVEIESKIKRSGISYGLFKTTGRSYMAVETYSSAIVDVPYGAVVINLSVANPTNKLDINDQDNWDKGLFDLEARVARIEPDDIKDWKESLFPEFNN